MVQPNTPCSEDRTVSVSELNMGTVGPVSLQSITTHLPDYTVNLPIKL